MKTHLVAFAVLVVAAAVPLGNRSSAHSALRAYDLDAPGPEASGCYFSRGQMFCGRYCYIEINGKRYCQVRERDAFPQGEVYIEESLVGPSRYRHRSPRRHNRHHGLK
jgi:hypothetical protein